MVNMETKRQQVHEQLKPTIAAATLPVPTSATSPTSLASWTTALTAGTVGSWPSAPTKLTAPQSSSSKDITSMTHKGITGTGSSNVTAFPKELEELGYTASTWERLLSIRAKLDYLASVDYSLRAALLNPAFLGRVSRSAIEEDIKIVDSLLDKVANRPCRYQVPTTYCHSLFYLFGSTPMMVIKSCG
jgi:hypothetical protein